MMLKPDDLDFISNFDTVWAVILGAVLATLGGFAATQFEQLMGRRERERGGQPGESAADHRNVAAFFAVKRRKARPRPSRGFPQALQAVGRRERESHHGPPNIRFGRTSVIEGNSARIRMPNSRTAQ